MGHYDTTEDQIEEIFKDMDENKNEINPEEDDIQESENADETDESETDESETDEPKNSDNNFLYCENFQHDILMFNILVGYIFLFYCIWNLQNVQQNICNTASTGVIFNDIYSGVNYHTIQD